jgi:Leucine-rich repeat (LRR) protein
MQVGQSEQRNSSAPFLPQPDRVALSSTSLLPLYEYQAYQEKIATQALPMHMVADTHLLPTELIEMIQRLCSHKDLLALTSVNKAAFAIRFHNPPLQHLRFTTATQAEFLATCRETRRTAALTGAIRSREDFQEVKTLTLTFSNQLTTEQCEPLFSRLPGVTHLSLSLKYGQRLALLNLLLKAASHLLLTQLTISSDGIGGADKDALPDELWQWHTLERLELRNCNNIREISEEIGRLTQLVSLVLHGSTITNNYQLTALPRSLGQLTQLEELIIEHFSKLTTLPEEIGQLTALKSLHLYDISLEALPATFRQLTQLEVLKLIYLDNIAALPDEIGQLTTLKSLDVSAMRSLRALPTTLGRLTQLEEFSLSGLYNLTMLPDEISQLTALKSLCLSGMPSLKALPATLGQLTQLEWLRLERLNSITALPEEMSQLASLRNIEMIDMPENCSIPPALKPYINIPSKNT